MGDASVLGLHSAAGLDMEEAKMAEPAGAAAGARAMTDASIRDPGVGSGEGDLP